MIARLSRPVNAARLNAPRTVEIDASEAERAAIAEALDIVAVNRLEASLTLTPWRGEGVRITGTVVGEAEQACVVTLDPVRETISEAVDVRLHPDAQPAPVVIDVEAEDPPEPMESDTVDVGAIALEHFALGLDPYPRAANVSFEDHVEDADEPAASPFAALAALKPREP